MHGVHKAYRSRPVLRGVDLEVDQGEVVALLGPNGAGKSTLLRMIVGSVCADAGRISICGYDVERERKQARLRTGWVLGDEHAWYWRLSARDNLVFFALLRGEPRVEARRRAREQLAVFGLDQDGDRRVGEYSTGMRARLALARAQMAHGEVLVLDEPGRGLDAGSNEYLIERLQSDRGRAVLLVTHDLEMVSEVATRSVLLAEGALLHTFGGGTPAHTLAQAVMEAESG